MSSKKALVREQLHPIDGVSHSWFEWTLEEGALAKTLVVAVTFDTDPRTPGFRQGALDEIVSAVTHVLAQYTTMTISHLRIVPASQFPRP